MSTQVERKCYQADFDKIFTKPVAYLGQNLCSKSDFEKYFISTPVLPKLSTFVKDCSVVLTWTVLWAPTTTERRVWMLIGVWKEFNGIVSKSGAHRCKLTH